jgi:hypothetical protein
MDEVQNQINESTYMTIQVGSTEMTKNRRVYDLGNIMENHAKQMLGNVLNNRFEVVDAWFGPDTLHGRIRVNRKDIGMSSNDLFELVEISVGTKDTVIPTHNEGESLEILFNVTPINSEPINNLAKKILANHKEFNNILQYKGE